MNPEERAARLWLQIEGAVNREQEEAAIAAAIREAVASEREACAAVCEESTAHCSVPDDLAAAIRARGDNP